MGAKPERAFRELFDLLRSDLDLPLSSEARSFLMLGAIGYCLDTETSLDIIFGIRRPRGGIPAEKDKALAKRDWLIARLWREHEDFSNLADPIVAAKLMSLAATRYEATRWPRERELLSAPAAEPAATWWRILRMGVPIPKSKRLAQILRREIQYAV